MKGEYEYPRNEIESRNLFSCYEAEYNEHEYLRG